MSKKHVLRPAFRAFRPGAPHRVTPSVMIRHAFGRDGTSYHAYEVLQTRGKRENGRTMLRVSTLQAVSGSPISIQVLDMLLAFTNTSPERRRAIKVKQLEPRRFELTFTHIDDDGESFTYTTDPSRPVTDMWTVDAVFETLTHFADRESACLRKDIAHSLPALKAKHDSR
jgi:hypothetical protein